MIKIKKILTMLTVLGAVAVPSITLAITNGFQAPNQPAGIPNSDLNQIILNITNWVLGFVTILAVLFLIWGGLQYLTAAGNEEQVEKAKNTITYALLGLIVAAISYAAVLVVVRAFINGTF